MSKRGIFKIFMIATAISGAMALSSCSHDASTMSQEEIMEENHAADVAKYEQAFNNWQNAIYKAGNEVSNALVSYNSYSEKSVLDGKRVGVLKQNVEDTKKLMESSSNTTYLEVISAQSSLLNAEISQVQDQFYKMQSVVNLYQALGGGAK